MLGDARWLYFIIAAFALGVLTRSFYHIGLPEAVFVALIGLVVAWGGGGGGGGGAPGPPRGGGGGGLCGGWVGGGGWGWLGGGGGGGGAGPPPPPPRARPFSRTDYFCLRAWNRTVGDCQLE